MSFARSLATAPIRFYRRFLSRLKPPMCRFDPTCSEYALVAIETHGIVRGTLLGAWRILRCNPFCQGGYDPVPPRSGQRVDHASPPSAERGVDKDIVDVAASNSEDPRP